jgi:O-antigen/teichoic acid export membrane protein
MPEASGKLSRLAFRGAAWTVLGYGAGQVLRLGSSVVLAWLLFPEVFGLVALVGVLMQGLHMFSDLGIQPSIVQNSRGDDPEFLNTAWTIQVIRGLGLWLLACVAAYPFALLYGQPQLAWVICVAGFTSVLQGFNSTRIASAERHLKLGALTIMEIIIQVTTIAVMITWAYFQASVWAVVAGGLVATTLKLVLSHAWLPGMPNRFAWNPESVRALVHFGKWVFLSTILTFCVFQADRLIFGQLVPLGVLGLYSIALSFAMLPQEVITRLSMAVAFPAFSRTFRETGSLESVFARMRSPLVIAGAAATAAMVLCGPVLIDWLYDARYADVGWILQLLSIGVLFLILQSLSGSALLATGRPRALSGAHACKLAAMVLLIPLGYRFGGFAGAVAAYAASEAFRYLYLTGAAARVGLRTLRGDLVVLVLWGGTVGGGLAIGSWSGLDGIGAVARMLILAGLVGLIWAPLAAGTVLTLFRSVGTSAGEEVGTRIPAAT